MTDAQTPRYAAELKTLDDRARKLREARIRQLGELMVPYRPDKRKTASYPLRVGREIAYWDPNAPSDPPIKALVAGD